MQMLVLKMVLLIFYKAIFGRHDMSAQIMPINQVHDINPVPYKY